MPRFFEKSIRLLYIIEHVKEHKMLKPHHFQTALHKRCTQRRAMDLGKRSKLLGE